MATKYRRGYDLERRARERLVELGAALVVRAAGSKGPVDLIAMWGGRVWLVQAKRDGYMRPKLAYQGGRGEGVQFKEVRAK
jgi:Holliday junction resolvase